MKLFYLLSAFLVLTVSAYAAEKNYDKDEARRISKVCAGCHGTDGAAPGHSIPTIGGQNGKYLYKTMIEFRDGKRLGTVMAKIALAYDDNRSQLVADYFEDQKWVNTKVKADKKLVLLGKKLSKDCSDCHGPKGKGQDENPRLAGQHPFYLEQALIEYKEGKRGDVPEMELIKNYTEKQLKALAAYFSNLK